MKVLRSTAPSPSRLRASAEHALRNHTRREIAALATEDVQKLVHELEVHQVELEMQNEELRRTHLELETARDRYADLYDFAPSAHLTVNAAGEIMEANLSAAKLLGLERARLLHQKFSRFLPPDSQDTFYLLSRQVFSTGIRQSVELSLVDAQSKPVFVHVEAVSDAAAKRQCRLSLNDISARKRMEEALLASSQFNQQIIAGAKEGIIVYDRDLKYQVWNPFMEAFTGLSASEVIGRYPWKVFPFLEPAGVKAQLSQVLAGRDCAAKEFHFQVPQTGRSGWASDSNSALCNPAGDIIGVIGIVNDITQRKVAELALLDSQRFAQSVVNNLSAHIAIVNHAGVITAVNQRWRDFAASNGASPADVGEGVSYFKVCQVGARRDQDIALIHAGLHEVLAGQRKDFRHEYPCHSPTEQRWFTLRATAFLENGQRQAVVAHEDITERRQAENRVMALNRLHAIMGGVDRAIVHIPHQQQLLEQICRVVVEEGGFKLAWIGMVAPDGSVHPVARAGLTKYLDDIRIVARDEPAGRGPVGTAIRTNQAVVITRIEQDDRMTLWHKRAQKFGLNYVVAFPIRVANEVVGSFQVYSSHADSFEEAEVGLLTQVGDEISFALTAIADFTARKEAELSLRRSEHNLTFFFNQAPIGLVWLAVDGTILRANAAQLKMLGYTEAEYLGHSFFNAFSPGRTDGQDLLKRLRARETVHNFRLVRRHKNGSLRHMLVDATPIISGTKLLYSSVFLRDITDRVELEQEILHVTEREQRRIAQDLHDGLGQQLVGAGYLTNSLKQDFAAKSLPEAERLGRIQEAINAAIAQTRNLARGVQPVEPEPNGLMVALGKLAEQTQKTFPIRCQFTCRPPVLLTDNTLACHLFRIAQEAVTNALKHGHPDRIQITLSQTPAGLRLAIKNNGANLPARPSKKAGMGLRIMRHRAGLMGGKLELQNKAGSGLTIVCTVPHASVPPSPHSPSQPQLTT